MEKECDAIMQEKLSAIKSAIQNAFPDGNIYYRGSGNKLYKFELVQEGITDCRLDFDWQYLLNNNENTIIDRLRRGKVFETILNASRPIKILLTDYEVKIENW